MRMTREEYLGMCDAIAEPKSPAEWDRIGQSIANDVMRVNRLAAVSSCAATLSMSAPNFETISIRSKRVFRDAAR